MIEGCVQWQRTGSRPAAVTHATETYLASEDAVATWIADCCEQDVNAFETTTNLFQSWKIWASHNGEDVGKRTDFCEALNAMECDNTAKNMAVGLKACGSK